MTMLFISYKRGTSAIIPLIEKLRENKYHVWYDKESIQTGDDWKRAIDAGIENSSGIILGLTSGACSSEYVQYEVGLAKSKAKPIFPVLLEKIDLENDLAKLGIESLQFSDLTQAAFSTWDQELRKLIIALENRGIKVTSHRPQNRSGTTAQGLHKSYLSCIVEEVGSLNLAQIESTSKAVGLVEVYVDLPTNLELSLKVDTWHITEWGMQLKASHLDTADEELPGFSRSALTKYDRDALGDLLNLFEKDIEHFREQNRNLGPTSAGNRYKNGHYSIPLKLEDTATAFQYLVILGLPGSGKSTFIKYLALCLAEQQLNEQTRNANPTSLTTWSHKALTPIFLELSKFVASEHFPADVQNQPTANHFLDYLQNQLTENHLQDFYDELFFDLQEGNAVILFDGLDEVPCKEGELDYRQSQIQGLFDAIRRRFPRCRIIVTSRPYAYEDWSLDGFQVVRIADFEDYHRNKLANNLFMKLGSGSAKAKEKASETFCEQLELIEDSLKDRPLFLTQMVMLYLYKKKIPRHRGTLYRESINLLLDRWTQSKPGAPSLQEILGIKDVSELYLRLAHLAHDVQSSEPIGQRNTVVDIPQDLLASHLYKLSHDKTGSLIQYISKYSGVIFSLGQKNNQSIYRFAHRGYMEYLSAVHILDCCIDQYSYEQVKEYIETNPMLWRETCRFVTDVLVDRKREGELPSLIHDLIIDLPKETPQNNWAIWLAARIIIDHKAILIDRFPHRLRRNKLIELFLSVLDDPESLPTIERADCGKALGLLGDTRSGVGMQDGIPDIEWVEIPGGNFIVGTKSTAKSVELDNFYISQYPITVNQFAVFVEDEKGYQNPDWWTLSGLAWRGKKRTQPEFWNIEKYHVGNHPVIGINWYEAVAYSKWLNQKLGKPVRLPTEAEWERAARGTDERIYPYGMHFDASKCNASRTGIESTSAVGLFKNGQSPYGVQDLCGNVYEWTLARWSDEYQSPEHVGLEGEAKRTVKGGAWDSDEKQATTFHRNFDYPFNSYYTQGFRLVMEK